jgi:dephospho-CoA kinase
MKETILSISGKPGLYRLVNQGRGNIIVETIDAAKKRIPAGIRDRVTSLNDISMYTDDEDVPLMEIFENIKKELNGKPADINIKTASSEELAQFMALALPNYDRDRVYNNDIKKLIQWYNILINNGYNEFVTPEEAQEVEETTEA